MTFRVVTIYDETARESRWTRVAVVKPLEDDPSVWGVVAYYATTMAAERAADAMRDNRAWLQNKSVVGAIRPGLLSHPPRKMTA